MVVFEFAVFGISPSVHYPIGGLGGWVWVLVWCWEVGGAIHCNHGKLKYDRRNLNYHYCIYVYIYTDTTTSV